MSHMIRDDKTFLTCTEKGKTKLLDPPEGEHEVKEVVFEAR